MIMRNEGEAPVKRIREDDTRHKPKDQEHPRSQSGERHPRNRDRSRSPRHRRGDNEWRDLDFGRRRGDIRDRKRDRSGSRDRYRYQKVSPRRNRSRSPPLDHDKKQNYAGRHGHGQLRDNRPDSGSEAGRPTRPNVPTSGSHEGEGWIFDDALMKNMMGFSGFRSTKNTKVPGNNVGAVRKDKQIKARQYMNRVGGFNRPLSPSR